LFYGLDGTKLIASDTGTTENNRKLQKLFETSASSSKKQMEIKSIYLLV